jgi:hypothetical protein
MKNKIFTFTAIGLIAGVFLTGCGKTSDQKTGNAQQELKEARTEYLSEWQAFQTESEQAIKTNEKRVAAFKEKMEKSDSKFKAKYSKDVVLLEQKNNSLKKKLAEYKDEGQSRWEEFKANFNHDLDEMGKTMKDLFKDNG